MAAIVRRILALHNLSLQLYMVFERVVLDCYFNVYGVQWKRIHSKFILRKLCRLYSSTAAKGFRMIQKSRNVVHRSILHMSFPFPRRVQIALVGEF
jgi:hypothetical protein